MLTTPLFGALGIAAWSKLYAKHHGRVSFMYFIAVFILLWIVSSLMYSPKARAQDEQKRIGGFSVTGSGEP